MPAEIYEGPFSRPLTSKSGELVYIIRGAADEKEARDKLTEEAPSVYDDKIQDDYKIEDLKIPGGGYYTGTVTYKAKASGGGFPGGGVPTRQIEFSTMGGTKYIQISPHGGVTFNASGWTQRIPDAVVNAEIDPGGKIRVKGAQIPSKLFAFKIKKRFTRGTLTDEVVDLIKGLSDCVNSVAFKGFDPREVNFIGAEGAQSGTDADVTFYFQQAKFLTGKVIDGITYNAGPFDYVWFLSQPETSGGVATSKVKEVHVNYVKEQADLNLLPI